MEEPELRPASALILTLALDQASQAFFERERRAYFPPERNLIPAHVTLFHGLRGENEAALALDIEAACRTLSPFPVSVTGLRLLGKGVAYRLEAAPFDRLRRSLQALWAADLTPQDRQTIAPHVTVQNKVAPAEAKALHARLAAGFAAFEARAEGLLLWRYLGGPWAFVRRFAFAAGEASEPSDEARLRRP